MNSPEKQHPDDPIDKLLREQDSHVADDGFTRRVLTSLPRRNRTFPRIVLLTVAIAGTAIAIYWMPWKNLPPLDYSQLLAPDSKVFSAWLPFVAVGVVLASAAFAAMRQED